jgi:hypothetical protein
MRWDNVFGDLELQWEREDANARWDEQHEEARATRSQMSFRDVLIAEKLRTGVLSVELNGVAIRVHVGRIGSVWLDGIECGSRTRVIASLGAVERAFPQQQCECVTPALTDLAHVTFGTVLRHIERRHDDISIVNSRFLTAGRITAVWSDSFRVTAREGESMMLPFHHAVVLVTPGA